MPLGVRNDSLAALAGADGDYAPLQVNATGALYVDGSGFTQGISGNVVATLVNERKPAGNYEVVFDAGNLPAGRQGLTSGIYFYTLRSGNFVESKKMILIK